MNIFKTKKFILTTLIFIFMTTLSFGVLQVFRNNNVSNYSTYALDEVTEKTKTSWSGGPDTYSCSVKGGFMNSTTATLEFTVMDAGKLIINYTNPKGTLTITNSNANFSFSASGNPTTEQTLEINLNQGTNTISIACVGGALWQKGSATITLVSVDRQTSLVQANANKPELGSVEFSNGEYIVGSSLTMTAKPNDGVLFLGFVDENKTVLSTDTTYSFNVNADTTITALFEQILGENTQQSPLNFTDLMTTIGNDMAEGTTISRTIKYPNKQEVFYVQANEAFSLLLNDVEQTASNDLYTINLSCGTSVITLKNGSNQFVYTIVNPGLNGTTITKGFGTTEEPYLICSQQDFEVMRSNLGYHFGLGNDITLTGEFTPIGDSATPFTGTFNGYNHKISKLKITSGSYRGLFANTKGAKISNLKLLEVSITGVADYSGMLIGNAQSKTNLNNVHVSGTISATKNQIGGLIGYTDSKTGIQATNCSVSGTVKTTGDGNIGGFAGVGGTYTDCIMNADVIGIHLVGGFIGGYQVDSVFTNCKMAGSVKMTSHHSSNYPYWGTLNGYGAHSTYTYNNSGQLLNFNYTLDETKYTVTAIDIFNSNANPEGLSVVVPTSKTNNKYNFEQLVTITNTTATSNLYLTYDKDKAETDANGITGNYGGFTVRFTMSNGTYKYVSTLDKTNNIFESCFDINLDDYTSYENNFSNISVRTDLGTSTYKTISGVSVFGAAVIDNANDLEHLSWLINGAIPAQFADGISYNARSITTLGVALAADIDLTSERTLSTDSTFILNRKGHTSNGQINKYFFGFGKIEMYPYRGSIYGLNETTNFNLTVDMDFDSDEAYCMGIICVATENEFSVKVQNITINGSIVGGYRVGIVGMNDNYAREFTLIFTNVINNANISGKGCVGAFLGEAQGNGGTLQPQVAAKTELHNCVNYGIITATVGDAGGLVGNLNHLGNSESYGLVTLNNCANNGKVIAARYAGGFVAGISNTITVQGANINAGIVTSSSGNENFYVGNIGTGSFSTTDGLQTLYKVNLGVPNKVWNIKSSSANLVNLAGEVVDEVSYTTDDKGFVNLYFANLTKFNGETLTLQVPLLFDDITITPSNSNTDNYYTDENTKELYLRTMATGYFLPIEIRMCENTNVYNATSSAMSWVVNANVTYTFNLPNQNTNIKVIDLTGYIGDETLESLVVDNKLVFLNVTFKHADYNFPETAEFTKNLYRITSDVEQYVIDASALIEKESGTNEEFKTLGLTAKNSYNAVYSQIKTYTQDDINHFNNYISNKNTNLKDVNASEEVLLSYLQNIATNIEFSTTETLDYGTYAFEKIVTFTMIEGDPIVKTLNYNFEKSDIGLDMKLSIKADKIEFKAGDVVTCSYDESVAVTINKANVGITFVNNESAFYDNTAKTLKVEEFKIVEGDEGSVSYNLTYNGKETAIEVGTYEVKLDSLSGDSARFYNIPENLPVGKLVINQVKYALETEHGKELTYDCSVADISYNLTQSVSGYNLTEEDYSIIYSGTMASGEVYYSSELPVFAGEYTATLTLHNVNLAFLSENSFEFKIKPKKLEIVPFETNLDYNAQVHEFDVSFTGVVDGDIIDALVKIYNSSGAEDVAQNAGEYSLQIVSLGNPNYYLEKTTISIVINKEDISIKLLDQNAVYGDEFVLDQTKFEHLSGTIFGDDRLGLKLVSTITGSSPAGNYEIKAVTNNNNYAVEIQNAMFVLDKRQATISFATIKEYAYASQDFYDDILPKVENVIDKDMPSFVFELSRYGEVVQEFKDAGTYSLKLIVNEQANEVFKNYVINQTEDSYLITPKSITLKPKNITKNYTQTITSEDFVLQNVYLAGQDKIENIIDFEYAVYLDGEKQDYTTLNVGKYEIKLDVLNTDLSLYNNYTITIQDGVLEIFQRETHIIAEYIDFKIYDEKEVQFNAIMADEFNNEIPEAELQITIMCDGKEVNSIKDVGTYEISVIGNAGANNKQAKGDYTIIINANIITISLNNAQTTYNGKMFVPDYNYNMSLETDISSVLTYKVLSNEKIETTAINVGDYYVEFSVSNSNYVLQKSLFNVAIKAINLTLTIKDQKFTYGDVFDIQDSKFSLSQNLVEGENLDLTFSCENFEEVAGSYVLTAKNSNKNYNVTIQNATLTILKRELLLTFDGETEFTFSEDGYPTLISVQVDNALSNEVFSVYYLNSDNQQVETIFDAGNYSLVVELHDEDNYKFSNSEEVKIVKPILISKKVMDLDIRIENKVYDGKYIQLDGVYAENAPISHDIYNIEYYKNSVKTTQPKDVGEYTIKIIEKNSNNYKFNNNSRDFVISLRQLSVSSVAEEFEYSREIIKPAITLYNVVEGEDIGLNIEYVEHDGKFREVGEYTIIIHGLIGSNTYNYKLNANETIKFRIVPTYVKVEIPNTEIVFTNKQLTEKDLGLTFVSSLEILSSDYAISTLPTTVGKYNISLESKNAGIIFDIKNFSVEILKANIEEVKFEDKTLDFDNKTHSIIVNKTILSNGTELVVEYSGNNYVDAGVYNITATLTNPNYNTKVLSATLTINQLKLSLAVTKQNEFIYNGTAQGVEIFNINSLWYSDLISYKYIGGDYSSIQMPTEVGNYTLEISTYNENNIKILNSNNEFIIKPKAVVITSTQPQITTYNAEVQPYIISYVGVLSQDLVYVDVLYNNADELPYNAGEYVVTFAGLSGEDAKNYEIENKNLTTSLTINRYEIVVTAENKTVIYGDAEQELTYTHDSLLGADEFTGSLVRESGKHASSYIISQGSLDAGNNYAVTFVGAIYNITRRELHYSEFDREFTYNGTSQVPNVVFTNIVDGDTDVAKVNPIGDTVNAGTYKLDFVVLNPNYKFSSVSSFDITINKLQADEKIIALITTETDYSGFGFEPMVMIDGDHNFVLSYSIGGENVEEMIDAGTYTVTVQLDTQNFVGTKTFDFVVNKVEYEREILKDVKVDISSNCFVVSGLNNLSASVDNINFDSNIINDLESKTKYYVYVKVGESKNYKTTIFLLGEFATCPSAEEINNKAEIIINKEINSGDIDNIKDLINDYNNLTDMEQPILNEETFNELKQKYEEYFDGIEEDVQDVRVVSDLVDFNGGIRIRKLNIAISAMFAGILFVKKGKKKDESNN